MKNYVVKNFSYIKENHSHFIEYANLSHERFMFNYGKVFNQSSSTWFYRYYNITCLTFGSNLYFKMFCDLQKLIRKILKTKKPLWYQCWLNFHKKGEVLDWHTHKGSIAHGYVSIDPKESETEFKEYTIKNKIGNVYIGPSENSHRVNILKPFDGHRITMAFDVISENNVKDMYQKHGKIDLNTGFIPVMI
jgi:hypothetical protein